MAPSSPLPLTILEYSSSCSGVNWYLAHSDGTVSFVWFKALFGIADFVKVVWVPPPLFWGSCLISTWRDRIPNSRIHSTVYLILRSEAFSRESPGLPSFNLWEIYNACEGASARTE